MNLKKFIERQMIWYGHMYRDDLLRVKRCPADYEVLNKKRNELLKRIMNRIKASQLRSAPQPPEPEL